MPKRKRLRSRGPGRDRDARTSGYRHAVPDPNRILDTLRRRGVPLTLSQLAEESAVTGERPVAQLRRRLQSMVAAGQILLNRRDEYCLLDKLDAIAGTVIAHRDGFGFLSPDDGSEDIYLGVPEMRSLLDGDRAAVRLTGTGRNGRRAGALVEILARGRDTRVGHYQREHGVGYVVEAGRGMHHFVVPDRYRGGAEPGQLVKLEVMEYPSPTREAQGKVTEVIGDPKDPGVITSAAVEIFRLPAKWPEAAIAEAEAYGSRVRAGDKPDRVDLRGLALVTIDGEDARDFDDAVYAEPRAAGGWRLVVAIADVSHYVRTHAPLDVEARRRGTSVYFPDRVIPMLPEALSNGLCSLNPKVDRLCMVCDMEISQQGDVLRSEFYRAVMHSNARLTYTEVDAFRRGDSAVTRRLGSLRVELEHLYGVYAALARARARRGALDLDLPEVKISVGSAGEVLDVRPRGRTDAHRLIEECMIAANVQAARFLARHRLPTLFRVHSGPPEDKFEELRLLFQGLGVAVPDQARSRARHLNRVLDAVRARPDFQMLATALLRSLSQAVYQPVNVGHFGLALGSYAHFTSPIRRYPDLLVHRGIGHVLDRGKPGAFGYDLAAMEQLGKTTSMQERRADEAARHVEARYKCRYIEDRVGDVLSGVVTGVTHFGLFVTLADVYVDGLIHVTGLGRDYFHLEQGGLRLTGERSGQSFALGDDLEVRVVRVNTQDAQIDLALADAPRLQPGRRRGTGARRRRSG